MELGEVRFPGRRSRKNGVFDKRVQTAKTVVERGEEKWREQIGHDRIKRTQSPDSLNSSWFLDAGSPIESSDYNK